MVAKCFLGLIVAAFGSAVHASAQQNVDVAVIGAGLAGLSAAKDLTAAGKSVLVLEARDRVGGRVCNRHPKEGYIQEVGAEFVGPTQDRVLALASELGLKTYKTYNTGKNLLYINQTHKRYPASAGGLPPIGRRGEVQLLNVIADLNERSSKINPAAPWTYSNATETDSITFYSYLKSIVTDPGANAIVETATTAVFSATPRELSLLYVLGYLASAGNATNKGNFFRLIQTPEGAQESRIDGGTQLLAIRLAERLGKSRVALNAPVRRIQQSGSLYTVTADELTVNAKQVIVAMSPPLASRIIYEPILPASRDQLTQRMPMGALGKGIAIYKTPFWRKMGLTGQVVSDSGIIRATFDNSPPNGSYGAIMGFIEADEMRKYDSQSDSAIKSAVIRDYVNFFGPDAQNPETMIIQRWDRAEYSRGAPVAFAPPGVLTEYGPALRTPFGGIHFAGTESATYWIGYMSGAIDSGERAAKEVLSAMGP